jgi:hypothetical protein
MSRRKALEWALAYTLIARGASLKVETEMRALGSQPSFKSPFIYSLMKITQTFMFLKRQLF